MQTRSLSLTLSWVVVPYLRCLVSRLRKYLVFFTPSLDHWELDLKIAPFVLNSIIAASSRFFVSRSDHTCSSRHSIQEDVFQELRFLVLFPPLFLSSFFFLEVPYFKDSSLTFNLTISHTKLGLAVSSLRLFNLGLFHDWFYPMNILNVILKRGTAFSACRYYSLEL